MVVGDGVVYGGEDDCCVDYVGWVEVDVVEEDCEVRLGGELYFFGGFVVVVGEVGCCFEGVNGGIVFVELL